MGRDGVLTIADTQEKGYPAKIKDSSDRRDKAERDWRRMLDVYGQPPTPPDLYPVTYTPKSLLGVSGGIKIMNLQGPARSPNIALREAAKSFIERWRDLIAVDPGGTSLVASNTAAGATQLTYKQANYPFPIGGDFGEMTLTISDDGRLTQLDDRFIPVVDLPSRPVVEKGAALKKLIGRNFALTDRTGRQQQVTVSRVADIAVAQVVVLPLQRRNALDVHLAWQFSPVGALGWNIYVDAVNGHELKLTENSQP